MVASLAAVTSASMEFASGSGKHACAAVIHASRLSSQQAWANHAADPVVTRWKMLETGNGAKFLDETSGKPVLEFVCIQRKDTGIWAIPGGMVDPGEKVSTTVKREFMEEALDSTGSTKDNIEEIQNMVNDFFDSGDEVI